MTSSYLSRQLGENGATSESKTKKATNGLPVSWYNSDQMYQLERRAIFSRKWMLITHRSRLANIGDYLKYDAAGFEFVLTKDRESRIHGFHNVCRHRAFPVVTKDSGSARIFNCQYHGWSYGLNGKLAKAPGYQDLPTFDKSKNGLFPVHVHIDRQGFVWVNLSGKQQPEIAWDDDFGGVDLQDRFDGINFDDYQYDHTWEQSGAYNWKLLADNFNECYHRLPSQSDVPSVASPAAYSVETVKMSIRHNVESTPEQAEKGLKVASTYYFPNSSMDITPHLFFIQRFVPLSPTKSAIKYEVYRHKSSSDADFQAVNDMYKRIMSEENPSFDLTQQNLNRQVFTSGELHPELEKGALYVQQIIRDEVTQHWRHEQALNREIWPAAPPPRTDNIETDEDIDFCSGLACAPTQTSQQLVW